MIIIHRNVIKTILVTSFGKMNTIIPVNKDNSAVKYDDSNIKNIKKNNQMLM